MAERQRNPLVGAFEAPQRFIRGVLIHSLFTRSQLLSPPRLPSPSPAHIHSSFSPTAFLYNAQTSILVLLLACTEFSYSALYLAASNYSRHPKDVLVCVLETLRTLWCFFHTPPAALEVPCWWKVAIRGKENIVSVVQLTLDFFFFNL